MDNLKVYTARVIRTMDPGRPVATAIAVSGERIVGTGTLESLAPWLDRIPHHIDDRFQDKVLMPGFIDPHTHLRVSGMFTRLNYVGPITSYGLAGEESPCKTRDDVLRRVRYHVQRAEDPARPVLFWGYDPAFHGGHLDRDMLDEISSTTPIWVLCYAPHIVYANSPMLELAGVDEQSNLHGLGRYANGRLNGWFAETAALSKAMAPLHTDLFQAGAGIEALKMHGKAAVRNGVTATADLAWGLINLEEEWRDHATMAEDPTFPLRVYMIPFEPSLREAYGSDRFEYLASKRAQSNSRLAPHGIKWINDGSYPAMTLKLSFPGYLDADTGLTGEVPWAEMVDTMLPYWERGIQIHSHANGDETVDMTLDTLAALQEHKPRFDHRFTIEHYCISSPLQARRLAALGGGASVNPYFVHYRGLMHSNLGYGPDRSEATARLGSLKRARAHFCIHSDFNLVVVPMAPLQGAWIATQRLAEDGETVLAPGERIDLDDAIRAITIDAAYTLRRDHEIGSLEPGKYADMAILDEDPYEVGGAALKDIKVLGTISGGRIFVADE